MTLTNDEKGFALLCLALIAIMWSFV